MKVRYLSILLPSLSLLLMGCQEPPLGPVSNSVTTTLPQTELGAKIFEEQGCINCHSVTSASANAPGLGGLYGSEIVLSDGTKIMADENYIRESISNPKAKFRTGFEGRRMPAYKLTDEQMNAVIEYIKTLKK